MPNVLDIIDCAAWSYWYHRLWLAKIIPQHLYHQNEILGTPLHELRSGLLRDHIKSESVVTAAEWSREHDVTACCAADV